MTKQTPRIAQFRNTSLSVIMAGGLAVRPGALLTAPVTRDVELAVQAGRLAEVEAPAAAEPSSVEKKATAPAKKVTPPEKKAAPEPPAVPDEGAGTGEAPATAPGPSGVPMEQPKA